MSDATAETNVLGEYSDRLAAAVERAGASVARVEARRRQSASGIIWAADGVILTADHVLEREEDISVGLPDGRKVAARIAGRDPGTDLALLRAEANGLTPIARGPAPRVGHLALVVARPGGLETSIGVVSAIAGPARTWRGGQLDGFIRTDATFYPGFSGGPLVDADGRMIGLATSHFGQGTPLAIPLETVDRVAEGLIRHGRIKRGFLGLGSQPVALPDAIRGKVGGQESGLLVVSVEPNGPSERAGLLIGDILVALGGQPMRTTDDLRGQLGPEQVGRAVPAGVVRGGEPRDLRVTIGERE